MWENRKAMFWEGTSFIPFPTGI